MTKWRVVGGERRTEPEAVRSGLGSGVGYGWLVLFVVVVVVEVTVVVATFDASSLCSFEARAEYTPDRLEVGIVGKYRGSKPKPVEP